MAPAQQAGYAKDERVLCFHHELLYEAKILEVKAKTDGDKKDGFTYRVHYKGWKNTWDDWVPQERLRKNTDENKELAGILRRDMDAQRRAASSKPSLAQPPSKRRPFGSDLTGSSARGSEDRSSAAPQGGPRGTKRGREIEGIDKEDQFMNRPAVNFPMPEMLKTILVDDWEKVTKDHKLAQIPSPVPASQFLNEYYTAAAETRIPGSADADILEELIAGLGEYFNEALGRVLLYRFERHQFQQIYKELQKGSGELAGKTVNDIYGCEHLLRMFIKMPDLVAQTNMDKQSIQRLKEELSKMWAWMAKRTQRYFGHDYVHAGQEYLELSKSI